MSEEILIRDDGKRGRSPITNVTLYIKYLRERAFGNEAKEIITYHGGSGFHIDEVITLKSADIGGGGDLVLTVKSLEDNNASNMFLTNDKNNIRNATYSGVSGTKRAGGLYKVTVQDANSFTVPTATHPSIHNYVTVNYMYLHRLYNLTSLLDLLL